MCRVNTIFVSVYKTEFANSFLEKGTISVNQYEYIMNENANKILFYKSNIHNSSSLILLSCIFVLNMCWLIDLYSRFTHMKHARFHMIYSLYYGVTVVFRLFTNFLCLGQYICLACHVNVSNSCVSFSTIDAVLL